MQETKVLKMTPGKQKIEALQKMIGRNDERFNKLRKRLQRLQKKLSLAEREKLEKRMYLQVRMKERRQGKIEKLKEPI